MKKKCEDMKKDACRDMKWLRLTAVKIELTLGSKCVAQIKYIHTSPRKYKSTSIYYKDIRAKDVTITKQSVSDKKKERQFIQNKTNHTNYTYRDYVLHKLPSNIQTIDIYRSVVQMTPPPTHTYKSFV